MKRITLVASCFIVLLILLSSCGASRKVASGNKGNYGKGSANSKILTDASDARNLQIKDNKLSDYATLLGVGVKDLRNKSLYNFINDWMGSPHRMGGTQKSGVDCSGFVGLLYQQVYAKSLPRNSAAMGEVVKRKYEKDLKEGDLVFFSFGGKRIDHVGIYLHNNKFIHVSSRRGVIISNINDSWYYKYFSRGGTPKS